ncbi:MAG TPA: SDR family oxidoreductase [Xanthobacteraceae bacterium]|jgi:nucleoside-diphosphate-sugar epimerase|nr:SDR family oxidoreductase [Xanthobacteraceae bacterium]
MGHSILITGGAGYLGSILAPELLAAGHRVTVLDNFMYSQNSLAHVCADKNFDVVNGDARSAEILKPLVARVDFVFPLAALVGAPLCQRDPIAATSTNRDAIATLCKLMSPQQRIIMPITNSGYGVGEQGKFCTEDSPLRPVSLYGTTKVEAEKIALERDNSISLRLATVFGMAPRMRIDLLVNDFVYRAVNDRFVVLFEAHFKRNYIHIRDVARAFVHAIGHFEEMAGRPFNVGLSDANLSKAELCERIRLQVPSFVYLEAPVGEDPDKRDYIVSNSRIEATGYRPAHSLDDGISELIKGFRMIRNRVYGNI